MFDQFVTFLYTEDPEASRVFYEETLGLALAFDEGEGRIYRVAGEAFLGICHPREGRLVSPDGITVTLVTDDVDGWHARLLAKGVVFEKAPAFDSRFNIHNCFLRDPDGHLLEIQKFLDPGWPKPGSG